MERSPFCLDLPSHHECSTVDQSLISKVSYPNFREHHRKWVENVRAGRFGEET